MSSVPPSNSLPIKQPLLTLTVHTCKTRSTTVKDKWGKDWLRKNGDTTSNHDKSTTKLGAAVQGDDLPTAQARLDAAHAASHFTFHIGEP